MKLGITIILAALVLAVLIGWRIETKIATSQKLTQQAKMRRASASNVVVSIAKPGDIYEHLSVVGSVSTPYDVKLASKVSGNVDYLEVRPGDHVQAGQVLLRVNPVEQQAIVAQNRSALAEAQQRYTQALITQGPANVQVQTQIGTNTAQLAQAEANQNQVTVNYQAQVQAAQSAVADASAKVAGAEAQQSGAQQGVVSAQANYNDAAAKYARTYNLYKQGMISAQQADDAYAAQQVAEAAVGTAKQTLNAAGQAVNSAKAELNSAQQQLSIVKKQGQANIVAAQAATKTAKETLKYSRSNTAQIPAYQANLRALKAQVDAAQAQLANAEQQVKDTILKTPYPGTVTSRSIDPGSLASVGQQLLEVQFLDWLYVTCSAPIEYVNKTEPGQIATITFDALPGQEFHAPVVLVTPAADPTSRQFSFMVKLQNPDHLFKPGMFGHVDVTVGHKHADVMVPREAVQNSDIGPTVEIVDKDNVAHVTPVTLGDQDAKNIAITKGVEPGQAVIVLTYTPIKDGTKVTPNSSFLGSPAGSGKGQAGGQAGGAGRRRGGRSAGGQ